VWGSGPQSDKHLPQSLFKGQFLMTTFYIAFYESYLSTGSKQALFRSYNREWSVSPECKMVTEIHYNKS
jgi:hypothetical protein